jgi:hypothetical protein
MSLAIQCFRLIFGATLGLACVALAAELPAETASKKPVPGAPEANKAPPMAVRFKVVRDRVDALFRQRNETPAPIAPAEDPFRPPGPLTEARASDAPENPRPKPMLADPALLQQAAATLRVAGIVEIGERSHVVINGKPYQVGDVVPVMLQSETVPVRVRGISRSGITLGLNEAELIVKFGVSPSR